MIRISWCLCRHHMSEEVWWCNWSFIILLISIEKKKKDRTKINEDTRQWWWLPSVERIQRRTTAKENKRDLSTFFSTNRKEKVKSNVLLIDKWTDGARRESTTKKKNAIHSHNDQGHINTWLKINMKKRRRRWKKKNFFSPVSFWVSLNMVDDRLHLLYVYELYSNVLRSLNWSLLID